MKEIEQFDFVCATPVRVGKKGPIFGESTIVKTEKDLIVLKKNRRN